MNNPLNKGIFLSISILCSLILITVPTNSYAEEINVKGFSLEETTIMEIANDSKNEIKTIRIWLGSDFGFKSFKTEDGWSGDKTPQGIIVFTSSETIKPGEAVKFGIKTNEVVPGINWKALDESGNQMDTGIVLPGELPSPVLDPQPTKNDEDSNKSGESMSSESSFRIVPERPNIGSSIRVTGDNFGTSEEFDFYIDSKKIGSFETDKNGHFMTTMKIPEDQKADRVDFKIKSEDGNEKDISIRIGEVPNRIPTSLNVPLTIKGIPDVVHRGDFLEIYGTGDPGGAIKGEITTPEGEIINSRTAEINSKGDWKFDEPIIVPLDTPFGRYNATITDGRESKIIDWGVQSDKTIIIAPTNLKFDQGDTLKFKGSALPDKPIEFVLEDPLGKEIFSDIVQVDDTGSVEFTYPTDQNAPKGTYTLIAIQEDHKEFIFAGLGQVATIPVNLEFDKLNYKANEKAIITFTGHPSDVVSLLIIDPSDKPKGEVTSITLQPNARGTHSLDLKGYSSGVYTAVVSKGSAQSSEIFTVGLQTGSGKIEINATKEEYDHGDPVLILGDTGPNVLLTLTMTDPDGKKIKEKETFSDKNGKISEGSFRIPSDGKPGKWTINAKSGSNFDNIEIELLGVTTEGMIISVTKGEKIGGIGESVNIHIVGGKHTVQIEIIAEDGEIIEKLEFPASKEGVLDIPWIIRSDIEPGTYTIKAEDAFNSAETTLEIK
ncbi:biofilm-associated protein [Nitrosopumilus sp.]|uniref:biofilm-associated protein n=1 Tax=Nitrosopumilus sp. TaxID=2024843 RepID=UPI00292E3765|nr:biofilm-associated protein [Nitrosopumilus sp.]